MHKDPPRVNEAAHATRFFAAIIYTFVIELALMVLNEHCSYHFLAAYKLPYYAAQNKSFPSFYSCHYNENNHCVLVLYRKH